MKISEKLILTDCDGVILDWEYAFTQWMIRHGYECNGCEESYDIHTRFNVDKVESKRLVRMFNESAAIRKLPPLRDAMKYIKKLHEEHGFIFHAITSLSKDQYACHLRTKNLIELFGPTAFEKYVYLDTGADKDEELARYKNTGCLWVEDKPENAVCGANFGLQSVLIEHDHNKDFYHEDVQKVSSWKEIYDMMI